MRWGKVTTVPRPVSDCGTRWSPISIAFMDASRRRTWLSSLDAGRLRELRDVAFGLHRHQIPSAGDWRTWLLLGGRGSGKTFAGASWLHHMAIGQTVRLALVGPTLHDVREVMVEGDSGLRAVAPRSQKPRWEASRRRLVWPLSGSTAYAFSAEDPDSLRGPQFHHAWADEFCAWRKPDLLLSNLRMGMRLGTEPRLLVTTTPRPTAALRRLLAEPGTEIMRAATRQNAENLSPGFLEALQAQYGGTRLAAQELDGQVVEAEGALFRAEELARCRGARPPRLEKVVVAVDPPGTEGGDACGIVVAGLFEGQVFVLADRSERGLSPLAWGRKASEAAVEFEAGAVVIEGNQGGEMVRTVLAQAGCAVPVKRVHASKGKVARAEPVAALYEQGKVVHCGAFPALEEELMGLGGEGGHSPDRADALVWAVTELLLVKPREGPRVRVV